MLEIKEVYQCQTIKEAIHLLSEIEDSIIISGGTDVLIKVREHRIENPVLISIHDIKELKEIAIDEKGDILIGPCACFTKIASDPLILKNIKMLSEAADTVGGPQIRNAGTVGGNLCNGVTSADTASSLLALDAILELTSVSGTRQVPMSEFYLGPGRTVRRREELLTKIVIPYENWHGFFGAYHKYGKREAMEIATLGSAVLLKLSEDKKRLAQIKLAFGVAAPTPIRLYKAEQALLEREITASLYPKIQELVLSEITPRDSWRASKEFREMMAQELSVRGVKKAILRAGGEP